MTRGRTFLCTLNNPTNHYGEDFQAQDFLEKWMTQGKARYVCGQMEQGAEGTVHVQYALNFENSVRCTALKK